MLNSGDPVDIHVSAISTCRLNAVRGVIGKSTDRKSDGSVLDLRNAYPCDIPFTEVGETSKSLPPASAAASSTAASSELTTWRYSYNLRTSLKMRNFA